MENELTARQMDEWEAFYCEEPFDNEYSRRFLDHVTAKICYIQASSMRSKKSPPVKLEDFLLLKDDSVGGGTRKQTVEEMKGVLELVYSSSRKRKRK